MNLNISEPGVGVTDKAVEVSETLLGRQYNEALIHQVVVSFMAGARQGTKAQNQIRSTRWGETFSSKGTGAHAGTIRSPIWRGGGTTFAAKPRDHSVKVNKKMYRGAMQSILSELARQERLVVTENFSVEAPKTKEVLARLGELELSNVLVVVEAVDENLYLGARNLKNVDVIDVQGVNPVNLIEYEKVLFTVGALKQAEELLG